jgi:drug/metabolite transporter (DMT)-like permease
LTTHDARPAFPPRLALLTGIASVSTASIFIRYAQVDAPSLSIAAFRLALAALFLSPVAWLRHRREIASWRASEWGWITASGILLAVHFATWITSLAFTSVATSVVLVSTSPLWVALFARLFLGESLHRPLIIGLGLALGGSILISFAENRSGAFPRPLLGAALACCGALAVGGYWLIGRRLRRSLHLIPYVTLVYGIAALTLLTVVLLFQLPLTGFKTATYGWFLLLALIPQLLGHTSFNWALAHLPAGYVAIATLGEPIGAVMLAFIVLGEVPSLLKTTAAVLILSGIFLALRPHPMASGKSEAP